MEIRFKDGKPLMVGGGLIAGSQSCCCENPPPSACWCPDYCQYKIEVVSPEEFAVSTSYQCYNSYASRFTAPSIIQSVLDSFSGDNNCPGETSGTALDCGNSSSARMGTSFMESYGLEANVYSNIAKRQSLGASLAVLADVSYGVLVYCSLMGGGGNLTPQIFLQLDLRVRLFNTDASLGDLFFYARFARKIVRIDNNECEMVGNRKCVYLGDTYRRTANFQTPLEFTLSIGTTSFGNYEEDSLSGREFGPYQDVLDSLIDVGFEATFRITSRTSCLTVPRPCDINSDCEFYVVTVDGYDNPDCGAEYLYAWFATYEDAEEWALQYVGNGFCGTLIIDLTLGACCDQIEGDVVISRGCYPGPDELPFFTNLEPQELPCP